MVSDSIRSARTALGLTQQELAQQVGASQSDISALERGQVERVVLCLRKALMTAFGDAYAVDDVDSADRFNSALGELCRAVPAKPSQLRKAVQS